MKIVFMCPYSLNWVKSFLEEDLSRYKEHPATWIHYLAEATRDLPSTELTVMARSSWVSLDREFTAHGIRYCFFRSSVRRAQNRFLNFLLVPVRRMEKLKTRRAILRRLKSISPDILVVHGTELDFGLIADKSGFPYIVWMQGVMHFVHRDPATLHEKNAVRLEKQVFHHGKHFITKPGNMEEIIRQHNLSARFYNLFYPVSPHAFRLFDSRPEKSLFDIIFVGTFIERKGVLDLLMALRELYKKSPGLRVLFTGQSLDPAFFVRMTTFIEQNGLSEIVTIRKDIEDHNAILRWISQSRILVLPTYVDTAPVVVAESMAAGTPVIAYDVDGLPNMVKPDSGILVKLGDTQGLAKEIDRLLGDSILWEQFSKKGREFAVREYESKSVAVRADRIYQEITASIPTQNYHQVHSAIP